MLDVFQCHPPTFPTARIRCRLWAKDLWSKTEMKCSVASIVLLLRESC